MACDLEMALELVQCFVIIGTWSGYSKVWQDWEDLLSDTGSEGQEREPSLLYFIVRLFCQGMSHAGIFSCTSALAFGLRLGARGIGS